MDHVSKRNEVLLMKRLLAAMTAALMMVALVSSTVFAAAPTTSLMGQQWKVYNIKAATSSWDINKVKLSGGTLSFPIQQFQSKTTGSFAVYLLDNYNVSLTTSQTLSATMTWTAGTYETRSTSYPGAYVRLEFQDVTAGPYTASDYWWSTGIDTTTGAVLDLNVGAGGTLSVSLANCALWTNMDGISACVDTVGFANAMKNVKQLGLSFGSSGTYASGVALDGGTGTFTMSAFTVAP
jgi:hypothetical protein